MDWVRGFLRVSPRPLAARSWARRQALNICHHPNAPECGLDLRRSRLYRRPTPRAPAGGKSAFLSYAHADTAWAKWLHAALEGFRIDKDLVGGDTPLGPAPKTLRPIFRDREDFSGGHAL